ncbi:MAG: Hsp20/alpha crystallin family protein [Actinomycetota bacterium]|nr:Hsp20/alpha crystallin family protein [Actinomycetota bacterium]
MTTDIDIKKTDRPISRLFDWFEPNELTRFVEGLRPFEDRIRVEEEVVGDDLVIRAEMPGVDPDKDVDITIDGDVLSVTAERRKEEKTEKDGQFRSEFRYGSFRRSIRMPRGVTADDVTASYRDGILEVKVPMPKTKDTTAKVSISRS